MKDEKEHALREQKRPAEQRYGYVLGESELGRRNSFQSALLQQLLGIRKGNIFEKVQMWHNVGKTTSNPHSLSKFLCGPLQVITSQGWYQAKTLPFEVLLK